MRPIRRTLAEAVCPFAAGGLRYDGTRCMFFSSSSWGLNPPQRALLEVHHGSHGKEGVVADSVTS